MSGVSTGKERWRAVAAAIISSLSMVIPFERSVVYRAAARPAVGEKVDECTGIKENHCLSICFASGAVSRLGAPARLYHAGNRVSMPVRQSLNSPAHPGGMFHDRASSAAHRGFRRLFSQREKLNRSYGDMSNRRHGSCSGVCLHTESPSFSSDCPGLSACPP